MIRFVKAPNISDLRWFIDAIMAPADAAARNPTFPPGGRGRIGQALDAFIYLFVFKTY